MVTASLQGIVRAIMQQGRLSFPCVVLLLSASMQGSMAKADGVSGLYLGGSFGRAQNEYDTGFLDDRYISSAKSVGDTLRYTSSSVHRTDNAWWANAGYMVWQCFGIDASFVHLGELTHRGTAVLKAPAGDEPVVTTASITSNGPALSLLARLPLAESFDVDLRLGDYYARTSLVSGLDFKSKFTTGGESASASSLLLSVGGAYNFAGHWSLRLDYLRINRAGDGKTVGKYDVNLAAAGVAFTF